MFDFRVYFMRICLPARPKLIFSHSTIHQSHGSSACIIVECSPVIWHQPGEIDKFVAMRLCAAVCGPEICNKNVTVKGVRINITRSPTTVKEETYK